MRPTNLEFGKIDMSGSTQVRVSLDQATVNLYAELMEHQRLDPIQVLFDGHKYWIWDGYHRLHAAIKRGDKTISAIIRDGTEQEALERALTQANIRHGMPLSNADKVKKARMALRLWTGMSNSVLAKKIGVSMPTIAKYRATEEAAGNINIVHVVTGADGVNRPARRPANAPNAGSFDPDDIPMGDDPVGEAVDSVEPDRGAGTINIVNAVAGADGKTYPARRLANGAGDIKPFNVVTGADNKTYPTSMMQPTAMTDDESVPIDIDAIPMGDEPVGQAAVSCDIVATDTDADIDIDAIPMGDEPATNIDIVDVVTGAGTIKIFNAVAGADGKTYPARRLANGACDIKPFNVVTGADGKTYPTSMMQPTAGTDDESEPIDIDAIPMGDDPLPPPAIERKWAMDMADNPLPPKLVPIFGRRGEVDGILHQLSAIKMHVKEATTANDPLYMDLIVGSFLAGICNLYRRLSRIRPHAICPYCAGDGCNACHGRGWMCQSAYEVAPPEMK